MLTMADLIAVLSLCLTSFGLGYTIGCNKRPQPKIHWIFGCMLGKKNNRLLA